jgi:AcrR family transcriptional regulator
MKEVTSTLPRVELRKKPTQARSKEKYHRILDVVAELVESGGTDSITTNLIAEQVGVPIGTLYQFFPNKESILFALFERQLEELNVYFEPFLSEEHDNEELDELMWQAILTISSAYQRVPGMVNIMNNMHIHPDFRELGMENNAKLAKLVSTFLARRVPSAGTEQLAKVSESIIELGDAIFRKLLQVQPEDGLKELMLLGFRFSVIGLVSTLIQGSNE